MRDKTKLTLKIVTVVFSAIHLGLSIYSLALLAKKGELYGI